jgi:hypothetical protein
MTLATEQSMITANVDTDVELNGSGGTSYNDIPLLQNRPNSRISFENNLDRGLQKKLR